MLYPRNSRRTSFARFGVQCGVFLFIAAVSPRATARPGPADTPGVEEIYLFPMSHLDIGFTTTLDVVAQRYKDNIDQAIELCEQAPDFAWTIESLWQLEEWLHRSTAADVERLERLIAAGRIEVAALYANFRSGLLGVEETNRLLEPRERLRTHVEFEAVTAIQNDVPGYTDSYPRVLADGGVRYFWTGVNTGHGGGAMIPWAGQPFLWEGREGSRVLSWIDHDAYISVSTWGIYRLWSNDHAGMQEDGAVLERAVAQLEARGYPYRTFALSAALGDNVPPKAFDHLIENVRWWNAQDRRPKLHLATPRQFFEKIEKERRTAGREFAVHRGNWHGLWDARIWNPGANELARTAQKRYPFAEMMTARNAIEGSAPYYGYDTEGAMRNLSLHAEHTCGGDPGWMGVFNWTITSDIVLQQNLLTLRYAQDAHFAVERLISEGMRHHAESHPVAGQTVRVFNPLPRTHMPLVACDIHPLAAKAGVRISDPETGAEIPAEFDAESSRVHFDAPEIGALGWRDFHIEWGDEIVSDGANETDTEYVVENEYFRLELDPETGEAVSLFDLEAGRDLLDHERPERLGGLYVTRFTDTMTSAPGRIWRGNATVARRESAARSRLIVQRDETLFPRAEYILYPGRRRFDLRFELDRDRMPDRTLEEHSDFYSFPFPLNLDEEQLSLHVEGPDGFFDYPDDYLPGAHLGAVQAYGGIHAQEGDRYGITIANRQSFNWSIGSVNVMKRADYIDVPPISIFPQRTAPHGSWGDDVRPIRPLLFSDVVQFATTGWTADREETLIRDSEPGTSRRLTYEYSITTSDGAFRPGAAADSMQAFGVGSTSTYLVPPPTGAQGEQDVVARSGDLIRIEPAGVAFLALKQADNGEPDDYILRIRETDGTAATAIVTTAFELEGAWRADLTGHRRISDNLLDQGTLKVELGPHETVALCIRLSRADR